MSDNQTRVECKSQYVRQHYDSIASDNQTRVECKFIYDRFSNACNLRDNQTRVECKSRRRLRLKRRPLL